MKGISAYTLLQEASALMERVNNLGLKSKESSKKAAKTFDEAADKIAEGCDELKKEVERRRALKAEYERKLKAGRP